MQSEAFRGRHAVIARSNANVCSVQRLHTAHVGTGALTAPFQVWLTALRAHFVERKKVHIVGGINNDVCVDRACPRSKTGALSDDRVGLHRLAACLRCTMRWR